MCTVTFIPTEKGFHFTSSRDEKASRKTIVPTRYELNGQAIYFPKDELAGGTWFAVSENEKAACLLNGAYENHQKMPSYTKSRGVVLLESFQYSSPIEFEKKVNLQGVEPFTLLLLDFRNQQLNSFYELIWDGKKKYFSQLPTTENLIWSSATLYSSEVRKKREEIFRKWLMNNLNFEDKNILHFHNQKHGLAKAEDILMKGDGNLMTLSISQLQFNSEEIHFNYLDVLQDETHTISIQ